MDEAPYEFGLHRLDAREHALFRGDERIPLSPKVFELLHLLVQNAGRLVTREELMKMLWPETFVADGTLAQNVWLARKALRGGDTVEQAIQTVPRLGYRFTAEVRHVDRHPRPAGRPFRSLLLRGRKRLPLKDGENVLGRHPETDVPIEDVSVSRRHARIVVSGEAATLEDLGSKNGTYLRKSKIDGVVPLANEDLIRVGSVELVFRIASGIPSTQTEASRKRPRG